LAPIRKGSFRMNFKIKSQVIPSLKIGQISFNPCSRAEALDKIFQLAKDFSSRWAVTSNTDHLLNANKDRNFAEVVSQSDFVVADGWPIVFVQRMSGYRSSERVTGADLLPAIAERCSMEGGSIFIMGGLEGWAKMAAENLQKKYPKLIVSGTYYPPFGFENDIEVCNHMISMIDNACPKFVFLGVGSPKQELWIAKHRASFKCGVIVGVGMAIGFSANAVPRAPIIFQKLGLEWFFRMCSEPKRLVPRYTMAILVVPTLFRAIITNFRSKGIS
jgi:N-acetylglucosaminyldiphosphoundecaprenol N-acetyl-beta-D-mannosaminyltransferase